MTEMTNPLSAPMPEIGDKLFRALDRDQGGITVHPGGVTDADGSRDITVRRYLYEEGYKRAADLLVEGARSEITPDPLLYPIVFLYRQYLELKLKSLLNSIPWEESSESNEPPDHGLRGLWETVKGSVIPKVWPEAQPELVQAVDNCVTEFQNRDPKSTEFRYAEDKEGRHQTLQNLHSVDLSNFSEVMDKMANFLDCVDYAIGRWAEHRTAWY